MLLKIKEVGDEIRRMKSDGLKKKEIESRVEILKQLKSDFEKLTNQKWNPDLVNELSKRTTTATVETVESGTSSTVEQLDKLLLEIKSAGDDIRQMKSSGVDKMTGNQWSPNFDIPVSTPPHCNITENTST
ncbi:putative WHEP-TRS domain protein [Trichinella spiralis]|uniref:putative WHEP-TRS domain protein n=1 Tax=Trichinella spiralis TaxID=6334 RepID=UPI0001EFDE7E|nr:putative WHEP-TRS domain protein [Trichinella spiralis]